MSRKHDDDRCQDLDIDRKTTKAYELIFKKNGIPIDITGWVIYFTVKSKMEDSDSSALIKKDVTNHLDPKAGKTLIELSQSDTDIKGSYYYDVKFKDTSDNSGILYYGRIRFRETVTTRG